MLKKPKIKTESKMGYMGMDTPRTTRGIVGTRLGTTAGWERLAAKYDGGQKDEEAERNKRMRHSLNLPLVAHLRSKIAQAEMINTPDNMPICSLARVLELAKTAAKQDSGISQLVGMINRAREKTTDDVLRVDQLKTWVAMFKTTHPKSAALSILTEGLSKECVVPEKSRLIKISKQIHSQADFDRACETLGICTSSPEHIAARDFIAEVVNAQSADWMDVMQDFEGWLDNMNVDPEGMEKEDLRQWMQQEHPENMQHLDNVWDTLEKKKQSQMEEAPMEQVPVEAQSWDWNKPAQKWYWDKPEQYNGWLIGQDIKYEWAMYLRRMPEDSVAAIYWNGSKTESSGPVYVSVYGNAIRGENRKFDSLNEAMSYAENTMYSEGVIASQKGFEEMPLTAALIKEAVDGTAKDYWKKYFGVYGDQLVEDDGLPGQKIARSLEELEVEISRVAAQHVYETRPMVYQCNDKQGHPVNLFAVPEGYVIVAVDEKAKEYYKDYYKEYGEELVEDKGLPGHKEGSDE